LIQIDFLIRYKPATIRYTIRYVQPFAFSLFACALYAFTIPAINPGKRCSISLHRDVFCISTPRRSLRIKPASRSALKCWESVDLGTAFSRTFKKFEQLREHFDPAMSANMATRTGSDNACRIPSTEMSSNDG
jgi:hypothetical protein